MSGNNIHNGNIAATGTKNQPWWHLPDGAQRPNTNPGKFIFGQIDESKSQPRPHRRAMGNSRLSHSGTKSPQRRSRATLETTTIRLECDFMGATDRRSQV